jgi:molybdate transport system substrate-binding protein
MQNLHDVMHFLGLQARCKWLGCVLTGVLAWGCAGAVGAQMAAPLPGKTVIKVAAASNLKFVLADLAALYKQQSGQEVQLTLGASGQLVQQIRQGLPAALFISADEERVDELVTAGLTQDAGQRYATGRLALLVPKDSLLPLEAGLKAVVQALQKQDKLAIANPALAPYGLAAQEALRHEGLGAEVQAKWVKGENIAQTTQFVVSGAAQAGITALSLVLAPEVAQRTRYGVIPASFHAPLHQKMVLLKGAAPEVRQFRDFLLSSAARQVFKRHGYDTSP